MRFAASTEQMVIIKSLWDQRSLSYVSAIVVFITKLEELQFFSHEVRILGVYPAHTFRRENDLPAE